MVSRHPRVSALVSAAVTAMAIMAPMAAHAAPSPTAPVAGDRMPPLGLYNLVNGASKKCLAGHSGGHVTTYECVDSYTDQYWRLEPSPAEGYFRLQNRYSSKCLAMPGRSEGDPATTYSCTEGYLDQNWRLEQTSAYTYRLRNQVTDLCLTGYSGSVPQERCDQSHVNQWWEFRRRG